MNYSLNIYNWVCQKDWILNGSFISRPDMLVDGFNLIWFNHIDDLIEKSDLGSSFLWPVYPSYFFFTSYFLYKIFWYKKSSCLTVQTIQENWSSWPLSWTDGLMAGPSLTWSISRPILNFEDNCVISYAIFMDFLCLYGWYSNTLISSRLFILVNENTLCTVIVSIAIKISS